MLFKVSDKPTSNFSDISTLLPSRRNEFLGLGRLVGAGLEVWVWEWGWGMLLSALESAFVGVASSKSKTQKVCWKHLVSGH